MKRENGTASVPNISSAERRKRLMGGVVMFVVGLLILLASAVSAVSRWWRLALFPLFTGAATGYFQWREHT